MKEERENTMSSVCPPQKDLRVIVLGGNQSGKTSVINTVLGVSPPVKRTPSCVRREGEFNGRKLIFIDTPGWWRSYPLIDTAKFIKQDLVLSLSKCSPGPHAFLLVISTDGPYTEKNRRSAEEHLGLFGVNVWEYIIVVFTRGEYLATKNIEQHIEAEGEALKWILDKCSNRYHIFENDSTSNGRQITQLLGKVDGIVAKHNGGSFQYDKRILETYEDTRKLHEKNGKSRCQMVKVQRETLQKHAQVLSMSEFRILLLGYVCSGKTSAKNTILDIKEIVGRKRTIQTERKSGEVGGKKVTIVDTPGWWKYFSAQFTPDWLKVELRKSVTLDDKNPHAILLAIPADTTFREEQRKITEDNMKMFGDQVWRHTIVLFTSGDLMGDTTIEEHIEHEGRPLQWLVEKCSNRYHVIGKDPSGESSQVTELLEKIKEMVAGNSLFSLHEDTPLLEMKEMTEEPHESTADMVGFLDQEWSRMDKVMEETIIKIYSQTTALKGKGSMDGPPDLCDSELPCSTKYPGPLTTHQSTSESEGKARLSEQADKEVALERRRLEIRGDPLEKMRDMLQLEWGRREVTIMERCQGILSEFTSQLLSSEVSAHDLECSRRKVLRWIDGTSGHGSCDDVDEGQHE